MDIDDAIARHAQMPACEQSRQPRATAALDFEPERFGLRGQRCQGIRIARQEQPAGLGQESRRRQALPPFDRQHRVLAFTGQLPCNRGVVGTRVQAGRGLTIEQHDAGHACPG